MKWKALIRIAVPGRRVTLALLACLWMLPASASIDYDSFDDLLLNHVDNGFVDYDGIAADGRLDEFLGQIAAASPGDLTDDDARKAFWINAYNALAIHGVLNGESAETRGARRRFFKRMTHPVLGSPRSLDDIEHGELRPMGDPRIHFAIVCASISCPRLASRAYRPEQLDQQLDRAARRFINDPSRNRFDTEQGIAFLSRIFDWFMEDFAEDRKRLQRYLSGYVRDADAERELRNGDLEIRFQDYDWRLNGRLQR